MSWLESEYSPQWWERREIGEKGLGCKIVDRPLYAKARREQIIDVLGTVLLSSLVVFALGILVGYSTGYENAIIEAGKACDVLTKIVGGLA